MLKNIERPAVGQQRYTVMGRTFDLSKPEELQQAIDRGHAANTVVYAQLEETRILHEKLTRVVKDLQFIQKQKEDNNE